MKKLLLVLPLALLILGFKLQAQDSLSSNFLTEVNKKPIYFAGLKTFDPTFSLEYTLSYQFALEAGASANWGLYNSFFTAGKTDLIVIPSLFLNYRFFYNKGKRLSKDKNIQYNSANYLSIGLENYFPMGFRNNLNEQISTENTVHFTFYWGLRRTFFKKMRFAFEAGPGLEFSTNSRMGPTPFIGINLNLGWQWQKK